jgi:hypothetical protein
MAETAIEWTERSCYPVGGILDRLDAQADRSPLARDAARVIRRLVEQLSTTETDLIEAEFSRYAHAVEIERMKDHRAAFEARRNAKAGRR